MLSIKESLINGKGVFANIDIPSGTFLHYFQGIEMSYKDFKEKYNDDTRYCYSLRRQNKIIVAKDEPYYSYNISNYMNESNNPNTIFKKRAVYTLYNIKKGDELLLKYPRNYPRNYNLS